MTILSSEILRSMHYRTDAGLPMPLELKTRALKAMDGLAPINAEYHDEITQSLLTFFEGGSVTSPKNIFRRATTNAFNDAFEMGWVKGGRDLPLSEAAGEWLFARLNEEYANIDSVFVQAKALRKDKTSDVLSWVSARADGYVSTLQSIYNAARMYAAGGGLLTWRLGNTEKHCQTCLGLDGQSHTPDWYISRDYIPKKPGANLECKGYNCDCVLENADGEAVTI